MASEDDRKRKCFTFIWKLENASYCYANVGDHLESPAFTVDEIDGTNWKLELDPSSIAFPTYLGFFLRRCEDARIEEGDAESEDDAESVDDAESEDDVEYEDDAEYEDDKSIEIDLEIALLSSDCKVLKSYEGKNSEFEKGDIFGNSIFASWNEVYEKRSVFLPQDTLTARCRIWKSVGEMSKDVQCFARTRIAVEKRSFLWKIEKFSTLYNEKQTCEIKSLSNGERLMSFDLFLKERIMTDEMIYLKVFPNFQKIKCCTFRLSIVDAFKNTVKCFQYEFWHRDCYGNKDFTLCYTKTELMEKKNIYLPNDELSLWCECAFSCGIALEGIEMVSNDAIAVEKKKPNNCSLNTENELSVPKSVLIDDFKSMLNDSILCDIKLKASSQSYPAHKCVLSARSPVFKAMFSNTMKEKINDCVDIKDLNDDTVSRMLRYIYSADVGKLEWGSATDLYEAADKYQILNLKDICSFYLKNNLCPQNACEALVLADLHQDGDLKAFVRDFILSHRENIFNSEE
ncbi:unnamed protein product [Larinioides sclopetarius]|uniref:Speckle-type POZ protein n=1 Tax=Larinioides sclopetarius TaxID=280406 RepID=A0AAV1YTH5_9ARAC